MNSLKFKLLLAATGLSYRQAANLLGVSPDSVNSWSLGRRNAPDVAIDALCEYYDFMMRWASAQSWPVTDISADDEAMRAGFYGVNSYRIAASRVFLDKF